MKFLGDYWHKVFETQCHAYCKHFLHSLNRVFTHSHDQSLDGRSMRNMEWLDGVAMSVLKKRAEFWAIDLFKGLIMSNDVFSFLLFSRGHRVRTSLENFIKLVHRLNIAP